VLIFSRRRKKDGSCVRRESMIRSASSPYIPRKGGREGGRERRLEGGREGGKGQFVGEKREHDQVGVKAVHA